MMCEGAGEGDAKTGLVSATFTLSGQVNATLRASSHFFQIAGTVWLGWGREMEKREQSVYKEKLLFKTCSVPLELDSYIKDQV